MNGQTLPKKTRRPFVWQPPQVPRLADLFAGSESRRRLLAYWRRDGLLDLRDGLLFLLFRRLPINFVSWLGGRMCRFTWRNAKAVHKQLDHDLGILRPELDETARRAMIVSYFDNIGRVMAEFALLARLDKAGRMHHRNGEALQKLHAEGPVILLGLHIANWEVVTIVCTALGIDLTAVYQPPERAAQHRIAVKMRESLNGGTLLPPGIAGARPALRALQAGGVFCIFGDEEIEGRVMAPFFGNPAHLDGNFAIAARYARLTGAKLVLFHGERREGGHYHIVFSDPVALPSQTIPQAPLLDDVMALNAAIEPIVRAHCGLWYYLGYARPIAPVTLMRP